jgi:type IV pilus assembly protein PilY1
MKQTSKFLLIGSLLLGSSASHAALDIADTPLYVSTSVPANIILGMDDSGSMAWSFMPDNRFGICSNDSSVAARARGRSPDFNAQYYDPEVTYEPPLGADGTPLPDANFNAAWFDGYQQTGNVNLATEYRATWYYQNNNDRRFCGRAGPADYYLYNEGCGNLNNNGCYTRVIVGPDEQQNFANWYSYYRYRMMAARAGIGDAFGVIPESIRVGWARINRGNNTTDGTTQRAMVRGVRDFAGNHKTDFYQFMYRDVQPTGGTPLRQALRGIGQYHQNQSDQGPWSNTPGRSGGELLACRQSYTVLMTDGYWSNGNINLGNSDGSDGASYENAEGDNYGYTASAPFEDNHTDTLADVAMEFWKRDLAPDIANRVPVSPRNPAFWQHMVTYAVGLGVTGNIDKDEAFEAIKSGAAIPWPDPTASQAGKIDDLLHAAVNSRGDFFSASNPEEFSLALSTLISDIVNRGTSQTASSVTGGQVRNNDAIAFQTELNSGNWSGDLIQVRAASGAEVRRASEALPTPDDRRIFTDAGAFTAGLPTEVKALIDPDMETAEKVIRYVRGEEGIEGYRERPHPIGAIVNSSPTILRARSDFYSVGGYDDYVFDKKDLPPTVFVGTSGGMLHAFDALTMRERWAFVPRAVLGKLGELTDPDYEHTFMVDGGITIRDYQRKDGEWRTVLLGGLGAGGKGVFAIDITDPNDPDVLWDITNDDTGFENLGYSFSDPFAIRNKPESNGDQDWSVVFGNGYGGADNKAYMYIVDMYTGDLERTVSLGNEGTADNPNGLSSPRVVRADRALFPDVHQWAYAGDLYGDLWRIDLATDTRVRNPVFDGDRPITSAPQASDGGLNGFGLAFGTGKYFENGDNLIDPNDAPDKIYFMVDNPIGGAEPPDLNDGDLERVTGLGLDEEDELNLSAGEGWYRELTAPGERVLFQPVIFRGTVLLATFTPVADACFTGGLEKPYFLGIKNGGANLNLPNSQYTNAISGPTPATPTPPSKPSLYVTKDASSGREEVVYAGVVLGGVPEGTSYSDGQRINWIQIR